MSSLKLFRLLQDLVGRLNAIAVALRDEKLASAEAKIHAKALVEDFLDASSKE